MSLGGLFCSSLQIFPTLSSAIATDIRLLTTSLPRYPFKLSYHISLGPPFFACLPLLFATLFLADCYRAFFAHALSTSFWIQLLSFFMCPLSIPSFLLFSRVALHFHPNQLFYVTSITGASVPNPYTQAGIMQASNTFHFSCYFSVMSHIPSTFFRADPASIILELYIFTSPSVLTHCTDQVYKAVHFL